MLWCLMFPYKRAIGSIGISDLHQQNSIDVQYHYISISFYQQRSLHNMMLSWCAAKTDTRCFCISYLIFYIIDLFVQYLRPHLYSYHIWLLAVWRCTIESLLETCHSNLLLCLCAFTNRLIYLQYLTKWKSDPWYLHINERLFYWKIICGIRVSLPVTLGDDVYHGSESMDRCYSNTFLCLCFSWWVRKSEEQKERNWMTTSKTSRG